MVVQMKRLKIPLLNYWDTIVVRPLVKIKSGNHEISSLEIKKVVTLRLG